MTTALWTDVIARIPRNVYDRRQLTTQAGWWTTSGGSTIAPSGTPPASETSHSSSDTLITTSIGSTSLTNPPASASGAGTGASGSPSDSFPSSSGTFSVELTTFTTSTPFTTITGPSTTVTSFSPTTVTTSNTFSIMSGSISIPTTTFQTGTAALQTIEGDISSNQICIGHGLDSSAQGLLAAIVLPTAIGLIIWLIFAIIRPYFRQVYALREWFVQQDLRPKPLGRSFFAFLFPHVPLVPSIPSDLSDVGQSTAGDARLFPSDEELSQRVLWICFLIVLGWTVLALAGVLPLYLISIPCLADLPSTSIHGGRYSTLQDLSLSRLLRFFDAKNIRSDSLISLSKRNNSDPENARVRIIVLTVFTLVLGLLPALYKIIKEFNNLVAYRKRWLEYRCDGLEMGWLSARDCPGFKGWGEKRLKDFIVKVGLSSSSNNNTRQNRDRSTNERSRSSSRGRDSGQSEESSLNPEEIAALEVDVRALFTIVDTERLALLIVERDEILENLEIAETRYISSFRITTPDPSILSFEPRPPGDPNRPYISHPKPLGGSRGRRSKNPAFGSSSLSPTSFVAPSQYYKLRGVHGVTGGKFADSNSDMYMRTTLSDSIHARLTGSRFHELGNNNGSSAHGSLPLGSALIVDETGRMGPAEPSLSIPDPRRYGPNHGLDVSDSDMEEKALETLEEEWVDLTSENAEELPSDTNAQASAGPSLRSRFLHSQEPTSTTKRETFPRRKQTSEDFQPPHLRLQPVQPFVRPTDGVNFDQLGEVYSDITMWRTRLKVINAEIADVQRDSYNDIAEGSRVKGWLMVGRGLHFINGMQLIEGRAKEDISWDVLQNQRTGLDRMALWSVISIIIILLAAALTAVAGLDIATAPDVTHYLTFLNSLEKENSLGNGIATVLVPAIAACFFIVVALAAVSRLARMRGSVSISEGQLLVFKLMFFVLTAIATVCMTTIGALMFAFQSFNSGVGESNDVANGAIYMTVLALTIIIQIAIIFPGILLLQPLRLWRVTRAERRAITPRQRFRAVYPRTYDPSYATGACVLAIIFASTFAVIFPLICPAVVILLFLTLIAHRFLIGYVFARTHSTTGGLVQLWLLRRFGTLLSFQPILLGLILLSRKIWIEGGILIGTGVAVILSVESYTTWKTRLPGRGSLNEVTKDSLNTFRMAAIQPPDLDPDKENTSIVGSTQGRPRGSMASVLEMMSLTLAVMPTPSPSRESVPLKTETLDDLTATERAARTNPDAPPRLPELPFADHAEEMASILYAPELIAPPPIIWLPNDSAGVARSEALDLQKYHDLQVTLDIRAKEDVLHPRRTLSR